MLKKSINNMLQRKKKGLHSKTLPCCGVIETQNKGMLHIHILVWTLVFPLLLPKALHIEKHGIQCQIF